MSTLAISPFRGRFEIKLDTKGRLSLPAAYRQVLPGQTPQLVITNSRYRSRSCLHVYSLTEWEKLERRIGRLSSLNSEVQAFNRFYLSGGQTVDVDSQGRLLVPQALRRFAGLNSELVLVGMGEKFEVWSLDVWEAIYRDLAEGFEATMSSVAAMEQEEDGK